MVNIFYHLLSDGSVDAIVEVDERTVAIRTISVAEVIEMAAQNHRARNVLRLTDGRKA